ncbi:MAG: recombination protein RecR [Sphingobacteriia bacterium]|nr:recombination protein RecR [Sphingobacteriia bacterium]
MNNDLEKLINLFSKLPGLGPRSARRIVLHLIKHKNKLLTPLISTMDEVLNNIQNCRVCNNLDISNPCNVCLDNRRTHTQICVVEEIGDLWAIEKGGFFDGTYHVLGGTLSAIDGIGPDQLAIDSLIRRIENEGIEEVILANNATVEGKTTAHYITERIKGFNIKISRLAYGIPVGGEIDYLDELTLSAAISSRQTVCSD